MGYSIYIGEALPCSCDDPECQVKVRVNETVIPQAPPLDFQGGRSNKRSPSYGDLDEFARATGLRSLFGWKGELLPEHPGLATLKPEHLRAVQKARRQYGASDEHGDRLHWLEFWMGWALKNCRRPAIYND